MIANKLCIYSISILVVACICITIVKPSGLFAHAQYHGGHYEMANHYGGGHSSGGYGGYYNGFGGDEQSSEEAADERPKIKLGFRLKIPAIKFELPRVNLPKITVSAKIRQPDGPRVIRLPEINLDTSSKVSPPGAESATSIQSGHHQMSDFNGYGYGSQTQPQYGNENVQTFSFSTQGDEPVRPSHPRPPVSYRNQYRAGPNYGAQNYGSSINQPTYLTSKPNQYGHQQNYNNNRKTIPDESYRSASNDPDIGFNYPVYMRPGQTRT